MYVMLQIVGGDNSVTVWVGAWRALFYLQTVHLTGRLLFREERVDC